MVPPVRPRHRLSAHGAVDDEPGQDDQEHHQEEHHNSTLGAEPESSPRAGDHLRMLTARASTTANVARDTADSQAISIFAVRVNGMVSVGEKAMRLVIET